jgi:hypothetical protein
MTESEWLTCRDPERLWRFCRDTVSPRKARLFAVACCRHVAARLADERLWTALAVAECHADQGTKRGELRAAEKQVEAVLAGVTNVFDRMCVSAFQNVVARYLAVPDVLRNTTVLNGVVVDLFFVEKGRLLRDVVGNPFDPVVLEPGWLAWGEGMISRLAQGIYEENAFERLPILADALEEAGCTEAAILEHCRDPGQHVRGCWVVDQLLGKE